MSQFEAPPVVMGTPSRMLVVEVAKLGDFMGKRNFPNFSKGSSLRKGTWRRLGPNGQKHQMDKGRTLVWNQEWIRGSWEKEIS